MDELVDDTGAPQAGGPIFAETRDQNMPKGGIKKGTGGRPFLVPLFSKKRSIFRGGGVPKSDGDPEPNLAENRFPTQEKRRHQPSTTSPGAVVYMWNPI